MKIKKKQQQQNQIYMWIVEEQSLMRLAETKTENTQKKNRTNKKLIGFYALHLRLTDLTVFESITCT